jgi:hypothetical protein
MEVAGLGGATESGVYPPLDEAKKSAVSVELERILESAAFHTSRRSRQFLSYVVRQTLSGHGEQLKERAIGIDVFGRSPEDITAESSVVRKQAGEVRRRLEQYYKAVNGNAPVRIELPVGSYIPVFCFSAAGHSDPKAASCHAGEKAQTQPARKRLPLSGWPLRLAAAALAILLVASAVLGIFLLRRSRDPYPLSTRFWEPVSSSPESVVVCLAKPVVYLPSYAFYQKYSKTHGGDFGQQWQRLNERLPKNLDMAPRWSDMGVQEDYGIARGDAEAAFLMATNFGRIGKSSQLRIGGDCSLADLRSAPVVLIGAFNNRWTMEMMSTLHFIFTEEQGQIAVREQMPSGRVWKTEWNTDKHISLWNPATDLQPVMDYAVISRIKNSQTGQSMMIVAGIASPGTQAAAELVSSPRELDQVLRRVPPGWENKNLQMVLRVPVPNGITPTSPQLIASYAW